MINALRSVSCISPELPSIHSTSRGKKEERTSSAAARTEALGRKSSCSFVNWLVGIPGHSASDPDGASICRAGPPHEAQPSTLRSPSPVLLHRVNSRIRHFRQAVRALPYLAASAPWRARLICKLALEGVAAHLQIYATPRLPRRTVLCGVARLRRCCCSWASCGLSQSHVSCTASPRLRPPPWRGGCDIQPLRGMTSWLHEWDAWIMMHGRPG